MPGFLCFLFILSLGLFHKKKFKILNGYILVERPLEMLHLHPQWGPDTHNSPHQRGAVNKAEQPLFCRKIILKTIKSFSISVRGVL